MQYQMKNLYNFKLQIAHIDSICQSNIINAETYNCLLQKMSPHLIRRLCVELRKEYEEEYQKDEDDEKLYAIRQELNLLKREQVTNVDELCMDIKEDLNSYYEAEDGTQLLKCTKKKPYIRKCPQCLDFVSNLSSGLKKHQAKSCKAIKKITPPKVEENPAPEYSQKKTKKIDTKLMYDRRQNGQKDQGDLKIYQAEERISKRQMMELKRVKKLEENKIRTERRIPELKRIKKEINLGMDNNEYYCEQDDDKLTKKHKIQQHTQHQLQKSHSYPSFATRTQ